MVFIFPLLPIIIFALLMAAGLFNGFLSNLDTIQTVIFVIIIIAFGIIFLMNLFKTKGIINKIIGSVEIAGFCIADIFITKAIYSNVFAGIDVFEDLGLLEAIFVVPLTLIFWFTVTLGLFYLAWHIACEVLGDGWY